MPNWKKRSWNEKMWQAQSGLCCYCETMMIKPPREGLRYGVLPLHATREHLKRRVEGGGNGLDNLALAHRTCNLKRHDRNWLEWKSICMGEDVASVDGN